MTLTSKKSLREHEFRCNRPAAAVELAAQLADISNRAIGEHYGVGATAVVANRRRLVSRPDVLKVVETLGRRLQKKKSK